MFCVLLLCTFKLGRLPPYLFYILLLRDLFLILGGLLLLIKTGGVIQAKLAGKLTTLSLSLLIFSCMLGKSIGILLVVVLTLIFLSWFDYALEGYKRLKSQTSYEL
jgi:phosphatidylglycerophosphate synthase